MPLEKKKTLTFNQYTKSDKVPYIIYADIKYLTKKIDGCKNNPNISSTTKVGDHIPCNCSMSTIWGFDHIENKHSFYRGKDSMKQFCKSLKEDEKSIIDFEKKKILPLPKRELKAREDAKICYLYGKYFIKKRFNNKNNRKVKDHCHYREKDRGAAHRCV